jgi:hypothetical protein
MSVQRLLQTRIVPYLWAVVLNCDLKVLVGVLTRDERLEGRLDMDKEAAGLEARGRLICALLVVFSHFIDSRKY